MSGRSLTRCVKLSLILVDVLIFLSGLIMLIGGSAVQHQINTEYLSKTIGGFTTQAGSIICIIFGIFVLLFALFGLFAAVKDHQRFLLLYSGVMSLIFVIQFITGIVGLSVKNSGNFTTNVSTIVKPMFEFNKTNFETDFFQKHFECCGWNNFKDYQILNENKTVNKTDIPLSCCNPNIKNCTINNLNTKPEDYSYTNGCKDKLVQTFSKVIEAACGILVAMSIFNLMSVVLSIILARQIKTGYQFS